MNNFDAIFSAIKKYANEGNSEKTCYEQLEIITSHPNFLSLDFYLENLEGLGLITYDQKHKIITLTEKGKYVEGLFSSVVVVSGETSDV